MTSHAEFEQQIVSNLDKKTLEKINSDFFCSALPRIPNETNEEKNHRICERVFLNIVKEGNVESLNPFLPFIQHYHNAWENKHTSALRLAARRNSVDMLRCLLDNGFVYHEIKEYSQDPIYSALFTSDCRRAEVQYEKLKLLLAARAKNNIQDKKLLSGVLTGFVPGYQEDSKRELAYKMIDMLLAAGAEINSSDHFFGRPAIFDVSNPKDVSFLLSRGADINARDADGETALMQLARNCFRLEASEFFLQQGSDVNLTDRNGNSALHYATKTKRPHDIVRLLLKYHADPFCKNKAGQLPEEVLASSDRQYYPDYQEMKLEAKNALEAAKKKKTDFDALVDKAQSNHADWFDALRNIKKLPAQEYPNAAVIFSKVAELQAKNYAALLAVEGNQPTLTILKELASFGAATASAAIEQFNERTATELLHRAYQHDQKSFAQLKEMAEEGIACAIEKLHLYHDFRAESLYQAAKNNSKAFAELETMANDIPAAKLYLGRYYLDQFIAENNNQRSISAFFKPVTQLFNNPEQKALKALTQALAEGCKEAHYYLGVYAELKGQLSGALSHYFQAQNIVALRAESLQRFKVLSAHLQNDIKAMANLYQWLLNRKQEYLQHAFEASIQTCCDFGLANIDNPEFDYKIRLQLLTSCLTISISSDMETRVLNGVIRLLQRELKEVDAIALAQEIDQILEQYPKQRLAIILKCCLENPKCLPLFSVALLQFEKQVVHNIENTQVLENLWNQISNDVKAKLVEPEKKPEAAASSTTTSLIQPPKEPRPDNLDNPIEKRVNDDIQLETNRQIEMASKYLTSKELSGVLLYWIKLIKGEEITSTDVESRDELIRKLPKQDEMISMDLYILTPGKLSVKIHPPTLGKAAKMMMLQTLEEHYQSLQLSLPNVPSAPPISLAEQLPSAPQNSVDDDEPVAIASLN